MITGPEIAQSIERYEQFCRVADEGPDVTASLSTWLTEYVGMSQEAIDRLWDYIDNDPEIALWRAWAEKPELAPAGDPWPAAIFMAGVLLGAAVATEATEALAP